MAQRFISFVIACALIVITGYFHAQIQPKPLIERDADSYVPKPEFAKAVALGFDAVLADFYWLQAVQIIGEANADPVQYGSHLGRLIDVVTTLDPWVDHPYRFAAVWLTGTPEDVRTGNMLLRRSLEYHPWEWRNRFYLGYNLFFYLGEHRAAAEALDQAIALPGAPNYLGRLAARLRSEYGDIETAEVFLRELLADAADQSIRAEYQAALDEIQVEHRARKLDRAREAHKTLNGRDIESVEDLITGDHPILARLPKPWPSSLPESLRREYRWIIDKKTGRIRSNYYKNRYQLNFHPTEEHRRGSRDKQRQATGEEPNAEEKEGLSRAI